MAKSTKKADLDQKEKKTETAEAESFMYKGSEVEVAKPEVDEKYEALKNQHLRLQADFDNYKKRNATISTSMYNEGVNDVVTNILPTVDYLDLAIKAQKDEQQRAGIEMVKKTFLDVLKKYKVEEIKAQGEEFDPHFHEAVMNRDDEANAGKVVEVVKTGYIREGKVLRHAMVIVGQ